MGDTLQAISDQLVALSKHSGMDEHGYKKVMIPQPQDRKDALEHLNKNGYHKQKSFDFTDSGIVGEVRKLHDAGKSVWVMLDLSVLKFDLYVSSLGASPTAGAQKTTGSNTGGFARQAETERRLKGRETNKRPNGFMAKIMNAFRGK